MKPVTQEMILEFKLKKLKYDFMGYKFQRTQDLSFHHLIVPHRECKKAGLGDGYLKWNGAILKQTTSHDYLHIIEHIDSEIFYRITSEMIDENHKGRIDRENLLRIRDLLLYFEKENNTKTNKKGLKLIKPIYITDRIEL